LIIAIAYENAIPHLWSYLARHVAKMIK